MIEQIFALPQRSPKPLTVPWTMLHPERSAVKEPATAQSESLWQWIARAVPSGSPLASSWVMSPRSYGSVAPLVSQSAMQDAPASRAVFRTSRTYPASSLYPSKRCSASKKTSFPAFRRNSTEPRIILRFSSGEIPRTSRTCLRDAFPTSATTGAQHSARVLSPWESPGSAPGRCVLPKATSFAFLKVTFASSS